LVTVIPETGCPKEIGAHSRIQVIAIVLVASVVTVSVVFVTVNSEQLADEPALVTGAGRAEPRTRGILKIEPTAWVVTPAASGLAMPDG